MASNIGMCFDRTFPPSFAPALAERLEADGVDQFWVIEDCFYTAGVSLAAAALARTERLAVGLGILPAVARNPAITAMEIATLARLAPGRVAAGIGHGVQEWMDQMAARSRWRWPDASRTASCSPRVRVRATSVGRSRKPATRPRSA